MNIKNEEYYKKCLAKDMCEKGKQLWQEGKYDALLDFAKRECEFLIDNKPLTHKEMAYMFSKEMFKKHNIYIDQDLDDVVKPNKNVEMVFFGCKGAITVEGESQILNLADNTDLYIHVKQKGLTSIRLYSDSRVRLSVVKGATVFVFNYEGKAEIVRADEEKDIVIKKMSR